MSEVINFHPKESQVFTFFEVVDSEGKGIWGGNSSIEAIQWLRRSPLNSRLLVSGWDGEGEDAMIIGQPMDITKIVFGTLAGVL
jgi:hypothetical protein